MADPTDSPLAGREHVRPEWSAEHAARVEAALVARRTAPRAATPRAYALGFVAGVAVATVVFFVLVPRTKVQRSELSKVTVLSARPTPDAARIELSPPAPPAVPPVPTRKIALRDGSTIELAEGAEVQVHDENAEQISIDLTKGSGRFEIADRPRSQPVTVIVGDAQVRLAGSSMTAGRMGDSVEVLVHRGRVLVLPPGKAGRTVATGERVWVATAKQAAQEAPPRVVVEGAPPPATAPPPDAIPQDWRAEAREGHFAEAWAQLAEGSKRDEPRDPEELLLAADAARLSGHAIEAVPLLERLANAHPGDRRAPLAAFTLGRVLLDLGRPVEAANAFALARALAPLGPLAADALAREAEAWQNAGDTTRAAERAGAYLRDHPHGERAAWMRRIAGTMP